MDSTSFNAVGGLFLAKMGWAMFNGGLKNFEESSSQFRRWAGVRISRKLKTIFYWVYLPIYPIRKTLIYFGTCVLTWHSVHQPVVTLKHSWHIIIPIQTFIVFSLFMMIMSLPKIKALYQRLGSYIDVVSASTF